MPNLSTQTCARCTRSSTARCARASSSALVGSIMSSMWKLLQGLWGEEAGMEVGWLCGWRCTGSRHAAPQAGLPPWRLSGSSPNAGQTGEWATQQVRPASQFEASQNLDSPACNVWAPANITLLNTAWHQPPQLLTWGRPRAAYRPLPMITPLKTKLASKPTPQPLTWSRPHGPPAAPAVRAPCIAAAPPAHTR